MIQSMCIFIRLVTNGLRCGLSVVLKQHVYMGVVVGRSLKMEFWWDSVKYGVVDDDWMALCGQSSIDLDVIWWDEVDWWFHGYCWKELWGDLMFDDDWLEHVSSGYHRHVIWWHELEWWIICSFFFMGRLERVMGACWYQTPIVLMIALVNSWWWLDGAYEVRAHMQLKLNDFFYCVFFSRYCGSRYGMCLDVKHLFFWLLF